MADRLHRITLILVTAVAIAGGAPSGAAFDHARLAQTARTKFILPKYSAFAAAIDQLSNALSTLCNQPSDTHLMAARRAYRTTIVAWGQVELISFGPIADSNRYERILFWPDRRGTGRRQIRRLLRNKDESATRAEDLARKSVAVQGLGALELILYGDTSDRLVKAGRRSHACRYTLAIAANMSNIVRRVRQNWRDDGTFAKLWRQPGPDNPIYLTPRETTHQLVKAFGQTLEVLRDRRIGPALGFGPTRRKKKPILWRSKLSLELFRANIAAAQGLLLDGGLADGYITHFKSSDAAKSNIESIATDFRIVLASIDELVRIRDPFAQDETSRGLVAIGFPLKGIRSRTEQLMSEAADLSLGFNASDGD